MPVVKSVSRAVQVLNCLSEGASNLTDIAEICRLSKSTVHRLLRSLEGAGLVVQHTQDHRYYLGPLMTELITDPQITHTNLVTCAYQEIKHLNEILEETVNICVMPALQRIIIHELPGKYDLRITHENRRIGFAFAGATVRMLFSHFSDEQLRTVMKHITIASITGNTVTSKPAFVKKIKAARASGYAVSQGEKIPGALGIAAPVMYYPHPAAIAIIGPECRLQPRLDEAVREITKSARRISENVQDVFDI